ncbi:MAG: SpoIIIAH-like family protein [Lachnospiraceae bacterium]|nr:SpoIIIAH-like family protein [Agathobacter sp.]MDD6444760.1 SpoIIIAH-like family protein [Lachnospiraceae bacterium]MDY4892572.1 SpoIIIAH-like family protein [Agathobacter sp.]
MKKRIHKNQVVITALAVLIAVAGYVTYDRKNDDSKNVAAVANSDNTVSDMAEKAEEKNDGADLTAEELDITSSAEDLAEASTEDVENPGETVLTSAMTGDSDYAAKVKLNREQVRSKNKETLQAIIDNDSLDEAKKQAAVDDMIALTDIAEKESNAEMMLEAKGFTDVVVSMNDDGCDVVLNMGEATDARRAQVEDIVKRKTGVPADKIVITPIQ